MSKRAEAPDFADLGSDRQAVVNFFAKPATTLTIHSSLQHNFRFHQPFERTKYVSKLLTYLVTMKRDERGVTALEYGLIAALIAVAIISAVTSLGSALSSTFSAIASHFTAGTVGK